MKSVLVSHPHASQFATGVAAAFQAGGILKSYATGVAFPASSIRGKVLGRLDRRLKNRSVPLCRNVLSAAWGVEIASRLVGKLCQRLGVRDIRPYDILFAAHDFAVSLKTMRDVDCVYAFEDGALLTFRKAAQRHIVKIWDLPLPHYAYIQAVLAEENRRWPGAALRMAVEPAWKRRRKDGELAAADVIAVASSFTRASLDGLVRADQEITVTPYGFPVEDFSPSDSKSGGPFTVLSVGSHDLRKGTPYLLEAWRAAALRDAKLVLIGPLNLSATFMRNYDRLFEHIPHVARVDLPTHYAQADVLIFPTLGDGFGMVIQEAMASGTPVITTRCGGGPEVISDGEDGWIVQERNVDALVGALRMAASDRGRTAAMGRLARRRAEMWTWVDAGNRLVEQLKALR